MSIRFLLDTNVISEAARAAPDERVLEQIAAHEGEAALPSPVWHELWFGCARLEKSRRRKLLESWLVEVVGSALLILPYDREAARWHATERARLARRGLTPPFVDGQIAAIAAVNELTLVTSNRRDFGRFRGLQVVDWGGARR